METDKSGDILNNPEVQKLIDQQVTKGINTYKSNVLPKEIEKAINEKKIDSEKEELKKQVEALKLKEKREQLKRETIEIANQEGIPGELAELVIGYDIEESKKNIAALKNHINTIVQPQVDAEINKRFDGKVPAASVKESHVDFNNMSVEEIRNLDDASFKSAFTTLKPIGKF